VPDAGADQIAAPQTIVTLNGGNSSDPDGDALTLRWRQSKGPAVLLRDPDKAAPYFITPRVAEDTTLEFLLVVSDARGATAFPARVRVTVRP
jgi:large repetitive protein